MTHVISTLQNHFPETVILSLGSFIYAHGVNDPLDHDEFQVHVSSPRISAECLWMAAQCHHLDGLLPLHPANLVTSGEHQVHQGIQVKV